MSEQNQGGGPKTEAGKAVSRKNAITHGLLSKETLLPWEDAGSLEKLSEALERELTPVGELEGFFVDRIVADMWRLRRALSGETANAQATKDGIEQNPFALMDKSKEAVALDARAAQSASANGEKIARYATSIERSMYRALHELQRLQAARMGEVVAPPSVVELHTDSQG